MLLFLLRVLLFNTTYIISFVIVCFGFIVVPGVNCICFSYGSLVRFVFDALHSSSDCLV